MDAAAVLENLMDSGVSVWLDDNGKLLIDRNASPEVKELVRTHKQDLIDMRRAQAIMNRPGIRCIRLPLGRLAVACPLKADIEEIRKAMRALRMDSMPLVINDEGFQWISYEEWRRGCVARKTRADHTKNRDVCGILSDQVDKQSGPKRLAGEAV